MVARKTLCEHKTFAILDNPQFPRITVGVCSDCLDMVQVFVDDTQVWRTHR